MSFRTSCVLGFVAIAMAQDRNPRRPTPNLRVESDLVLVNTLVTNGRGIPVPGLEPSRFHLFEDGIKQFIKYFGSEDAPASIGLVLDASGSMGDKLARLRESAARFIRAANPADEYFLLEFRDHPEVTVPFTSDTDRITRAIDSMEVGGSTALIDAIYLALHEMRRARNPRKAVVVVSDGMDNHSRYSAKETERLAIEAAAPIYAINLWQPQRSGNRYASQRQDPGLLERISVPTGGRTMAVREPKKLAEVAELISSEIRSEYILGYVPISRGRDGKFHHLKVTVDASQGPRLRVSNRPGYYSSFE